LPPCEALRRPPCLITLLLGQFSAAEYLILGLGEQVLPDRHDRRVKLTGLEVPVRRISSSFLGL
jgi:hypothetical protein